MTQPASDVTSADILHVLREESKVEDLRDALQRAQRKLARRELDHAAYAEAIYTAAKDAALAVTVPPMPRKKFKGHREVALLHLTDWQYGKRTAEFDPDVLVERIQRCVAKAVAFTERQRASIPVTELHVLLGGDMVEGTTIFPGQQFEIVADLYQQLFGVSALIASSIATLSEQFDTVHVWEEYGNHGRLGRKGEQKPSDNVDRMAYEIARMQLVGDTKRITWHPATTWFQNVDIGNYHCLLIHGDEIGSFGGGQLPAYGIKKKVTAWKSGGGGKEMRPFGDCYMGHYHTPDIYTLPDASSVYMTGSPESANVYAAQFMAATGRPSQRLHFVDPDAGTVTGEHRLWLD